MKFLILIITILSFNSCIVEKSFDYTTLEELSDIDNKIIRRFYFDVLDTIFKNHFVEDIPITKLDEIPNELCFPIDLKYFNLNEFGRDYNFFDKEFAKKQTKNNLDFKWNTVLSKKRILTKSYLDKTFREDDEEYEGWDRFRAERESGCICRLSIPIFSKDFKKVFVECEFICAPLLGFGEILVYEFVDNKWTLINRCQTWIS